MNKKEKGFSLAELLIALLIISVVLSAAIPTITKKSAKSSEKIWRWSNENNSIYAAVGGNQSVIIGAEQKAFGDDIREADEHNTPVTYIKRIFPDKDIEEIIDSTPDITTRFTTSGDKVVLFKESIRGDNGFDNLINSHISFYNLEASGAAAAVSDVHYAGRIASDRHNLAFGIGTLQNSVPVVNSDDVSTTGYRGFNTAIGHYAAFANCDGEYNTAVGEKSLSNNIDLNFNTALGYFSMFNIRGAAIDGAKGDASIPESERAGQNTAIGALTMQGISAGTVNTAIGYMALANNSSGEASASGNTAIGSGACGNISGNNNICIGRNAGAQETLQTSNYGFYIGGDSEGNPFMYGNMNGDEENSDAINRQKNLTISSDVFQIKGSSNNAAGDQRRPIFFAGREDALGISSNSNHYRFNFMTDNTNAKPILFSIYSTLESAGTGGELVLDTSDNPGSTDATERNLILSNRLFFGFGHKDFADNNPIKTASIIGINGINNINLNDVANFTKTASGTDTITQFTLKNKTGNGLKIEQNGNNTKIEFVDNLYITKTGSTYNGISLFGTGSGMNSGSKPAIALLPEGDIYLDRLLKNDSDGKSKGGMVSEAIQSIWERILVIERDYLKIYSDIRLKENISESKAGLKEINALEVKNYTYKKDKTKTPHVGVIAQQLQKVFPNAVTKDKDGFLQIRQEDIFYAMVNSIKELFAKIQDLTAKITGLDKRLTELEKENAQLKKQNAEFEKRLSKLENSKK